MIRVSVTKKDIIPTVYFIISMFQKENTHRQGTSSKSDLLGGYIDRWINKVPEDIIFNMHLLKDKDYKVVNDYFIYGKECEKNAPDILGIRKGEKIDVFTEFYDNKWISVDKKPFIEIKTFRINQKLVSVRETQLADDYYYVFIESDFEHDYLLKIFEQNLLSDVPNKIIMNNVFIKSNRNGLISQPNEITISSSDVIGTVALLTIISGKELKKRTIKCGEKENLYYVKSITEYSRTIKANDDRTLLEYLGDKKYHFGHKCLIFDDKILKKLNIVKLNKGSIYVKSNENLKVYGITLEKNKCYKIELCLFERSSKWTEYIAHKNQFDDEANSSEELISKLDTLASGL